MSNNVNTNPNLREQQWLPYDDIVVIRVSGEDAASFLQRQLAVEISDVTPAQAKLGAYLNPKGRVIANFILVMHDDSYCLVVDQTLAEAFSKRLGMYVFREKIEISIHPELKFAGGSPVGENIDADLPQDSLSTRSIDDLTVIKMPGDEIRYGIILQNKDIQIVARLLTMIDPLKWHQSNLEAGIPWISAQTSESFVAQAINLDLIDAVSWTKGCYPGQEIVARLHYRGGINRRMVLATAAQANGKLKPGDSIECPDLAGNQTGTVVNCSVSDEVTNLLLSVPLKFIGQAKLLTVGQQPIELRIDGLPYVIPELDKIETVLKPAN